MASHTSASDGRVDPLHGNAEPHADEGHPTGSRGSDLETYARATARLRGLTIEEEWWPGVLGHLGLILRLAEDVEGHAPSTGEIAPSAEGR